MFLYHVTPKYNRQSIMTKGVDPNYSQGRRRLIWVCEWERLTWALAHISAHQSCAVDVLLVCIVGLDLREVKRTSILGVYTYHKAAPVLEVKSAVELLGGLEELMQYEGH